MRNPVVFMFSGQGSQFYHMGKELYDQNPIFRRWMLKLNDIVYQNNGFSIVDEIYNPQKSKADKFDDISYTHPAIFMVEYSLARVFIENGIEPDYVLGASLGEYTAAAVAGVLSLEETLSCILKQAELVKNYCRPGSMIAIVAAPELYFQSGIISSNAELAAVNYSSHFVISGDAEKLLIIEDYLKSGEIFHVVLPVHVGFHSTNIDLVADRYKNFLQNFSFKRPEITKISCSLGSRVMEISAEFLWNAVRKPICFQKTILELEKNNQFNYIDLGPSGTLANFTKKILNKDSLSQSYVLLTPFEGEIKMFEKIKTFLQNEDIKYTNEYWKL